MPRALAALFLVACAGFGVASLVSADEVTPPEAKKPGPRSSAQLTALIDAEIAKVWSRDGVTPATQCGDETFLRRVYLDVTGLPPTVAEAEAFLADTREDKRARLIDTLLADERFGRHMADLWMDVLVRRDRADMLFAQWLADQFNADRGLDQVFYDIITAAGAMQDNPAVAYYLQNREYVTPDIAGNAARHFTGVQIQCAQCHDHVYEKKWTMDEFSGVASFFAPLRVSNNGRIRPNRAVVTDGNVAVTSDATIAQRTRNLNELQKMQFIERVRYTRPKFLLGQRTRITDSTLWRAAWAKWVISPDNTQTQRYMANRVWAFAFGRGLHNPVDDFNSLAAPSHPELLDALAADFRAGAYSIKRLYRAILNSRTWQLAPDGAQRKDAAPLEAWHFASSSARPLSAEQFFGALVTMTPQGQGLRRTGRQIDRNPYSRMFAEGERFEKRRAEDKLNENEKRISYDFEALVQLEQMYEQVNYEWIVRRRNAAQYARQTTDDERTESDGFTRSIDQALLVMNGQLLNSMATADRQSILAGLLSGGKDDPERLRLVFLTVLSRTPTEAESKRLLEYVKGGRTAWEDVIFALFMTTEFATNH